MTEDGIAIVEALTKVEFACYLIAWGIFGLWGFRLWSLLCADMVRSWTGEGGFSWKKSSSQ